MLANKDRLSRPSKGRYFPVPAAHILSTINQLEFKHSEFHRRIDLFLQNPDPIEEDVILIAAFYPSEALVSYSFSNEFLALRAQTILQACIREFRLIDKEVSATWRRKEVTSFRAYLSENNVLRITRRTRVATLAKYRGGAKFSNAFKPKRVATAEQPYREVAVT